MASSMLANSRLLFYASRRLPRSTPELQFVRVRQQQPQQQPQQQQQQRRLAGHSKWANIRHKKGKEDKARAAIHGKASRAIYGAAKECGGDLSNLRLQSCIGRAKSVQLPKNRIEEAITKATSKSAAEQDLVNLRFDAILKFGGSKVACVITALSDNRNRTTQNVRHLVTKEGGELLPTDKLAYIFEQVGQIMVENVEDEESLFECALEAGATNVEENEDEVEETNNNFQVTTEEKDLWQVVTSLRDAGCQISQFEHRYILQDQEHGGVELSTEGEEALVSFLDKMDENEDVNNVFHNAV